MDAKHLQQRGNARSTVTPQRRQQLADIIRQDAGKRPGAADDAAVREDDTPPPTKPGGVVAVGLGKGRRS